MNDEKYVRIYGLLGSPLRHTLSPQIHNSALEIFDIPGFYVPFDLGVASSSDARSFLDWAWQLGVGGLNVTLPYKELFAEVLNASEPSINTIVRTRKGWKAESTDGVGFFEAAKRLAIQYERSFDPSALLIIGNGGAAKALAYRWLDKYPGRPIHVMRRSKEKDSEWLGDLSGAIRFIDFDCSVLKRALSRMDSDSIVTQATSAPLYGEDLSDLIPAFCDYDGLFMDMVYGQPSGIFSFLLSEGKVACDGLPMLIEQALASQRLWWGRSDSYERVLGILSDDRK